ncbi:MAG: efflux transporter outer membrane subunit [bacterium]
MVNKRRIEKQCTAQSALEITSGEGYRVTGTMRDRFSCAALSGRSVDRKVLSFLSALGFIMVLFAGCAAVGPDYVTPDLTAPGKWSTELSGGLISAPLDPQAMASWWTTLNDPVLTSLIERAVSGNLDLRKSRARLVEARARRGISGADRFPTLKTSGSVIRSRSGDKERTLFNAGFDADWELDLFGRVRRSQEAAEADLEASRENMQDVLISLLAEVALNYLEVRSFQTRLSIASKSLKVQEETYMLTLWRSEAGLTSQLDVEQARSSLEETRGTVPSLQMGLDQALNRLAFLLGQNPGSLHRELSEEASPMPVPPIEIAIGVPADALRRIPGVRQAERQLAAQTARVGVACTDRYPRFTLTGSIGLEAQSIPDLFESASQVLRIGPNFSWTLFDAGRIRQNIEVQNALQEQALISYEEAILTALRDVEDALFAYGKEQVRRKSLKEAAQAAQTAEELATSQYSSGLIDFQAVLNAQRSWLSLQNQLAVSDSDITSNLIRLYKALGGGWTPLPDDTPLAGPLTDEVSSAAPLASKASSVTP